jgi:two-component system LytT family response regulator
LHLDPPRNRAHLSLGGFEVLENLAGHPLPVIILVTAYDQYALKAFEVSALDYLLKPFDDARFHRALSQARHETEAEPHPQGMA